MIGYAKRDRVEVKMSTAERFPRPWRVEEAGAAFLVKDAKGVVVGRAEAGPAMTREEARAIAERMITSADALASKREIQLR